MIVTRKHIPTAILALLVLVLIADGYWSCSHAAPRQNRPPGADHSLPLGSVELQSDPRLQHVITLACEDKRIDDVLAELTRNTSVPLGAIPKLGARRISCRFTNRPASVFLWHLTQVMGVSWRREETRYACFQTNLQIAAEMQAKRASEAREAGFLQEQTAHLHADVATAVQAPNGKRSPMATFLTDCDSSAIENGYASALEDEPLISATDQSHFLSHFFEIKPFSSLSPAQQQAAGQIARSTGYKQLANDSQVGLIAAAGSFRLGIATPNQRDVWVAPAFSIGRAMLLTDEARENDFDANVVALLESKKGINLEAMPARIRKCIVAMEGTPDPSRLWSVLMQVAKAADFDFLSDSYLSSNYSVYLQNTLQKTSRYSVEEMLQLIGYSFAHRMAYRGGLLEVTTMTPGLDLRLEPNAAVMNSIDRQAKTGKQPEVPDLLVIADCTKIQLGLLLRYPAIRKTRPGHLVGALRIYPFMQMYGSLTPAQKAKARTDSGLNYYSMNSAQRMAYSRLLCFGRTGRVPARFNLQKYTFYVKSSAIQISRGTIRGVAKFFATLPNDPTACHSAAL